MTENTSLARKVLVSALLVISIYWLATALTNFTLPFISDWIHKDSFAQKNFYLKAYMLLLTGLVMWLFKRRYGLAFGFSSGSNLSYILYLKKGLLFGFLGLLCTIIINIIVFAITRQKPVSFPAERLMDRILFIWIWSSLVEEILFRGLIQSYLNDFRYSWFSIRKVSISPAVFLSAFYFAGLHLVLLLHGMSFFFAVGIVVNAFILGLVAGYYREQTGSIWPAVFLHILFNIVGSLPLLLQMFI